MTLESKKDLGSTYDEYDDVIGQMEHRITEENESSRGLPTDLTGRVSSKAGGVKMMHARYDNNSMGPTENTYSHYRQGLTSIMLARRQQ